jgi:hypothetical protein
LHIYAFGSICRGDIDSNSDIDLLAIIKGSDLRFDSNTFSIYSYSRITELWKEGNPFAWHLSSEAKFIYSVDGSDFIQGLGSPQEYNGCEEDCNKFHKLFINAFASIKAGSNSPIFELSSIFLAIRNFATCYLLGQENIKDFSRNSALHMRGKSLKISRSTYEILEKARMLSTRGVGGIVSQEALITTIEELSTINNWMEHLLNKVK